MGIAVQMYTIRDFTRTREGLVDSMEKMGAIGYRAVQLSAVGAMDGPDASVTAAEARALLDAAGIRCIATHRDWDSLANETAREIDFHRVMGCNYVAIGGLPGRFNADGADGCRRFVGESAPVIARLKEAGIRFGYHNHAHEFVRIGPGRRTLHDIFVEEGGADLMLELDVYWADHAGVNPIRLFERALGRVPVVHLKDREVIAEGPVMAPIGEGNLDWEEIIPTGRAAGVEWFCVEQDVCRRDPFDCLRASYEFLVAAGA